MDQEDVVRQFRFTKEDPPHLRSPLRIPVTLTTNGWVRAEEAGLCDLELMFGRYSSTLSIVSNQVHRHIAHTFDHLLRDLTAHSWLNPDHFDVFAERKFFSGHKRYHCTKYAAVMCPNGIIARLDGPYKGCRHDAAAATPLWGRKPHCGAGYIQLPDEPSSPIS
ncbi:hypothetical protein HPB47_013991 [Ixodes persulcatus]|uniref:Uncharacterized protein n=1 Tax=Ixodes persulcatus TaxID=34615 RepID=A0AC60QZP0_IXOPE|nr:hypothetical protein HPB47_013991 [Ixodes persulcatus]